MKKTLPPHARLIPESATRVFRGQIFDVYQWPQKLYDGSDATFEMLRRPDTIQVIAVKDGKLVMVNDEQPNRNAELTFPGGRADEEDESWLAAAQREMREETGLTFKNWRLIWVHQSAQKIEHFVAWYVATDVIGEQPQQLDAGEKISVETADFAEIRRRVFADEYPSLNYAMPLFLRFETLDDLLGASAFKGQEVDR
ncbi:MAG TPA: NUDIX domain-containing protein [Candidatus Saccharimonadales bacterium]